MIPQMLRTRLFCAAVLLICASATSACVMALCAVPAFAQLHGRQKINRHGAKPGQRIVFNYFPSVRDQDFKKSESLFMAIDTDGTTQVVRYGPYNPAVIAVYEGKLPHADVMRLLNGVEEIIPRAAEISKPYIGSCDAETFDLSIMSRSGLRPRTFMRSPACLLVMPDDIKNLIAEMREVWKRLPGSTLAYGYVRSFPVSEDFLKSRRPKLKFASIQRFPPKLRAIIRAAIRQTPRFYAVQREQYEQLQLLSSDQSQVYVFHNGRAFSITGFLLARGQ